MEGVWQQTRSPDASSSETFIHTHELTYTPTYTNTHIGTPSSLLSRALSRPHFPAVRLSQNLLRASIVGILETSSVSRHPSRPRAGVQREGWTALRTPAEKADGTADKGESGEHKALFKEQSSMDRFPPSHLCLSVFCLARVCVGSLCVCCLVPVLTAGL